VKVIMKQIWNEPAAAIGLLTSALLAVIAVADGADWDAQTIIGVIAPLASALGIRQLVSPAAGPRDQEPPAGTTYQSSTDQPASFNPATKLPDKE
jgi:hypothetical protein